MYGTSDAPEVAAYTDRWRAGRYRVELQVDMPFEADDVDRALEKLGYCMVDADQAGCSYVSRRDRNHAVELDEPGDWRASVHLVLGTGDLEKTHIGQAGDYLRLVYEQIRRLCLSESYLYDHDRWDEIRSAQSETGWLPYRWRR